MKRIFFIAPHLSTGGMPQYLYKQIEAINKDYEVYCLEWDDVTGGKLVIQRNRIKSLLGNRLITLNQDKHHLFKLIEEFNPSVIHLQEIPEMFMPSDVAEKFYSTNRTYKIIETSHDSSFDINRKIHFPDKFMMVSQYQVETYKPLNIPTELVEYPIEYKTRTHTREQLLNKLGLDPDKKHVINVGLFTPRKNQAEVIEYARILKDYPIQFHFIGNQADNFQYYWEPLMKDFPSNCKWWGERNDVDTFFEAADLFLFTSRGSNTDKETMPLVIREAISWKTPSLIFNLDVYLNYFNKFNNIQYLDFKSKQNNILKILKNLKMKINPADEFFDISFNSEDNKITIYHKKQENKHYKISIKDKDSNAPIYWFEGEFHHNTSWWMIPIPKEYYDFTDNPDFGSFLLEFYDDKNNFLFDKTIFLKESNKHKPKLNVKNPFDCLFNNYNEMFVDSKYDCYELDKMDIVLDIGANSGLFSLLAITKGAKKVYAFEPNKESIINLEHIVKNLNVEIVDKAVYTKDEDLKFYIDPTNTTIGSISKDHILNNGDHLQELIVPAISLKTFFTEKNIDRVSLVKMDIEGAEYDIIENLEPEVFEKIDNFLIEYHDNTNNKVEKLVNKLIKSGYDIDQIRNQNTIDNKDIKDSYITSVIGTIYAKKSPIEKLVTVIIPTYNHQNYVEKAIDSVLKQKTLFNFNIHISDDISTDNTFNIIQKYKDYPNVTIFQNSENLGPTSRMVHTVLKRVQSKYVTILDGDDYLVDDYKLQKQVDFLEKNPQYTIHSTGYYLIEKDNINEELTPYHFFGLKEETTLKDIIDINHVGHGPMYRNSILKDLQFPDWYFDKDIFDGYWALNVLLHQYGKAKNERWASGIYRITPNGHFGEKPDNWKEQQTQKQKSVYKKIFGTGFKDVLVNTSNINLIDMYNGHFGVTYKGVPYLKAPMDYVLYQMIIMLIKPDLIIEVGTLKGGGALYYADLLELIGNGEVHTINLNSEIEDSKVSEHSRIKFFYGGYENYNIEQNTKGFKKILIIDDASHSYEDVLKTLNKFHSIVSKDSYFIIEDGVVSFNGLENNFNGGPRRAIEEFLQTNDNFIIDRSLCDFFGTNATFNPDGYLKRIN
jgi:FkbM family methyltransferase